MVTVRDFASAETLIARGVVGSKIAGAERRRNIDDRENRNGQKLGDIRKSIHQDRRSLLLSLDFLFIRITGKIMRVSN